MESRNPKHRREMSKILKKVQEHIQSGNERKLLEQLEELKKIENKIVKALAVKEKCGESVKNVQVKQINTESNISNIPKDNSCQPDNHQRKDEEKKEEIFKKMPLEEKVETLHNAINKGDVLRVEEILNSEDKSETLLTSIVQMPKHNDYVKTGQLPLSIAALRAREDEKESQNMLSTLLKKSTLEVILQKNPYEKDNVFHSLIKHGALYPEKIEHIKSAFLTVSQAYDKKLMKLDIKDQAKRKREDWFGTNGEKLTPLQLSAKLGVSELYELIINLQDVYCFPNPKIGYFDVKVYDVTEIDPLINYFEKNVPHKGQDIPKVLDMIFGFHYNRNEAFKILNQQPIRYIIQYKWKSYKFSFSIWMMLHILYMVFLTVFSILKMESYMCEQDANPCKRSEVIFYIASGVNVVVGVLNLMAFICAMLSKYNRCRKITDKGLLAHNIVYILLLLELSLSTIFDAFLTFLKVQWNYHIIIALICGWNFTIFFLTPFKYFGSFTYMMRKALLDDLVPFAGIITIELMAFTGVMHICFIGSENRPEEFQTYLGSLLTMFRLGIGLDDVGVLNEALIPWLAYTVYVLYTVISYILLINALIAVMSQTFSFVLNEKGFQKIYQKMSAIALFEDIFCIPSICFSCPFFKETQQSDKDVKDEQSCSELRHAFSFIKKAKHWKEEDVSNRVDKAGKRCLCSIKLLEDKSYSDEDREHMKKDAMPDLRTIIQIFNGEYFYCRPKKSRFQNVNRGSTSSETQTDITIIQVMPAKEHKDNVT